MNSSDNDPAVVYEIQVQGQLGPEWKQWFNGIDVRVAHTGEQAPTTSLVGPVADQAALRGLLCKLWDLNLTLISVRRVDAGGKEERENG